MNLDRTTGRAFDRLFHDDWRWLLAILCLSLLAYGMHAFNQSLLQDDWAAGNISGESTDRLVVGTGRWFQVLLWYAFANNAFGSSFTVPVLTLGSLLSALIVVNALEVHEHTSRFAFAGFFVFSPYLGEMYLFKQNHLSIGAGLLSATLSATLILRAIRSLAERKPPERPVLAASHRWAYGVSAALLFVITSASYQSLTILIVLVVACGLFLDALRDRPGSGSLNYLGKGLLLSIAIGCAGLILYAASVRVSLELTGFELRQGSYSLISTLNTSADSLGAAFRRTREFMVSHWFGNPQLLPLATKVPVYLSLGVIVTTVVVRHYRSSVSATNSGAAVPFTILALLAVLVLLLLPWTLQIVRSPSIFAYRALTPVGMGFALLILLGMETARPGWPRAVLQVSTIMALLAFVFIQSTVGSNAANIYERDYATTLRLTDRIERIVADNKLEAGQVVVFILGQLDPPALPVFHGRQEEADHLFGALTCNIVNCQTARIRQALSLQQTTATRYFVVTALDHPKAKGRFTADELDGMRTTLKAMPPWPATDSIRSYAPNVLLVKLSESR